MALTLGLIGVAITLTLALASAAPATRRSRMRATSRRTGFVRAFPQHANSGDVVSALTREGVSAAKAQPLIERASRSGIELCTLWRWIDRHGAAALSMVEAARALDAEAPLEGRPEVGPEVGMDGESFPEPESSSHAQVRLGDNVSQDGRRRTPAA